MNSLSNANRLSRAEVLKLVKRVKAEILGTEFKIDVEEDKNQYLHQGYEPKRLYIQVSYTAKCTKTGVEEFFKGRKWYLSPFMTDDEIIKTCYVAVEAAVKHEIMEGFKVDNIILFNPHVSYEALLEISDREVKRQ